MSEGKETKQEPASEDKKGPGQCRTSQRHLLAWADIISSDEEGDNDVHQPIDTAAAQAALQAQDGADPEAAQPEGT